MKKKRMTLMQKRAVTGLLFILPWLIGFVAFYLRSIIMTVQFSLSDITLGSSGGYQTAYVGFKNFIYAFTQHGSFKQTLVTSLGNMVVDVPLITFFSLFMAILLNQKFKGRTFIRAIFFLPVIMNSGAIQGAIDMARSMLAGGLSPASADVMESVSGGLSLEYYMEVFSNLAIPPFLINYIVGAVARISSIITASGVQIVIFIAALQSVPTSLYEVAKIEGATGYETFWKVTFPMVTPHIITNVVYTVVDSFVGSNIVDLAYTTAFTNQMWGLSSAMSIVTTVVVCGMLLLVCKLISRRTFYYN